MCGLRREVEMEEQTIGELLLQQVVPPLVTAAGLALGILIVWLRSKTAQAIRANIKSESVQKALLWANGLVGDLVGEASQTIVRELKQKLADGKITKAEYREALSNIKDDLLAHLSHLTLGRLIDSGAVANSDDGRALLASKIEAAVPLAKATQVAAGNGGVKPS